MNSDQNKFHGFTNECICCRNKQLDRHPAILMPFVSDRALGLPPQKIDATWNLRSLVSGNSYFPCHTLVCSECGTVFCSYRFSHEEMTKLYKDYRGIEYNKLREFYEPEYAIRSPAFKAERAYNLQVEEYLSNYVSNVETILDWGGDTGLNTPFKENCKNLHIFEINTSIAGEAIVDARTRTTVIEDFEYDLVVCAHVLEHVSDPLNIFSKIKTRMQRNSVLYVEVPFENLMADLSPENVMNKNYWHEHVNFFSERSLLQLARSHNMSVIDIRKKSVDIEGNFSKILQMVVKNK